ADEIVHGVQVVGPVPGQRVVREVGLVHPQAVLTRAAVDHVHASADADDGVVARAAVKIVVAGAAEDLVIACVARDGVTGGIGPDHVIKRTSVYFLDGRTTG